MTDRDSGRSKGFGFVEMSSSSEAQSAIEKMNGQEFEGRALTVNEARPQNPALADSVAAQVAAVTATVETVAAVTKIYL